MDLIKALRLVTAGSVTDLKEFKKKKAHEEKNIDDDISAEHYHVKVLLALIMDSDYKDDEVIRKLLENRRQNLAKILQAKSKG